MSERDDPESPDPDAGDPGTDLLSAFEDRLAETRETGAERLAEEAGLALRRVREARRGRPELVSIEASERWGERIGAPSAFRLLQLTLEVEETGPSTEEALRRVLASDRVDELVRLLDEAPPSSSTARRYWRRLARPDTLRRLLSARSPDFEALDLLLRQAGTEAVEPLVEAVGAREPGPERRRLLGRLVRHGPEAAAALLERLVEGDESSRSLELLAELLEESPEEATRGYFSHPNALVRRGALGPLLSDDRTRRWALRSALDDPDPAVRLRALEAAREGCPAELVPRIASALRDEDLPAKVREAAAAALGRLRHPRARDALVETVIRREGLFRWRVLRGSGRGVRAALRALADGVWSDDRRARRALEVAREADDPEVRIAAAPERGGRR